MAVKSKRRKIKVAPYDSADCLKTEAAIKNYLEAVLEVPVNRQMLINTLRVVARARGLMKLSKETGITRAGLYKGALSARQSELRYSAEDCRCIQYAAEPASNLIWC
jgi:probable addiction module antidote protein